MNLERNHSLHSPEVLNQTEQALPPLPSAWEPLCSSRPDHFWEDIIYRDSIPFLAELSPSPVLQWLVFSGQPASKLCWRDEKKEGKQVDNRDPVLEAGHTEQHAVI